MTGPDSHSGVSPIKAGLACRCPNCGQGPLFRGLLTVVQRCATCGQDLSKADSADGPAFFVMFFLSIIVVPLMILLGLKYDVSPWLQFLIWPPIILVGAILLLRPAKGILIALQYHYRASDSGTEDYD